MEKSTKIVEIDDMGTVKKFKIRLFDVLEGLDFFDAGLQRISSKETMSVRPFLSSLLRLCTPMDVSGENELNTGKAFTVQDAAVFFQNPLSVLDLGMEVLEFQKVFIQSSPKFRKLTEDLSKKYNIKILG